MRKTRRKENEVLERGGKILRGRQGDDEEEDEQEARG